MKIKVTEITEDPAIQLRESLDMERIEAMREFTASGGVLPPVTVVGEANLLADGHHRLYVAIRDSQSDIEANRVAGGKAEAIAIAIRSNDIAGPQPLTRGQRNAGIKALLDAGWTQRQIAKETGVSQRTVSNIAQTRETRATLPTDVNAALTDTHVARIATLPEDQRKPFAVAAASTTDHAGHVISEPRVREAIKTLKANPEMAPGDAVALHAPSTMPVMPPKSIADVAIMVQRRLDNWTADTITINGVPRDLWDVLDVLVSQKHLLVGGGNGMAHTLADLSVRFDAYATKFATTETTIKRVSA